MSLSHRYRNFGSSPPPNEKVLTDLEQIEERNLESFENGYKSGWDDAVAAQETTRANVTAEFGRNLQEISFSFHEARAALAKELRNVLEPVLTALLPKIAGEALAAHVLDQIDEISREAMERRVEIAVSPQRIMSMQTLFEDILKDPFEIVADDTLSADQVFIRIGTEEREIDFEPWLQAVRDALASHFDSISGS